jgi:hypothetical protein
MNHELTSDAQEKIERMSYSIALKRKLDFDGRKEITGHIEDKVLAYMNGEEAVTEADALILAQKHFGCLAKGDAISNKLFGDSASIQEDTPLARTLLVAMLPIGYSIMVAAFFADVVMAATIANLIPYFGMDLVVFLVPLAAVLMIRIYGKRLHEWAEKSSMSKLILRNGWVCLLFSIALGGSLYGFKGMLINLPASGNTMGFGMMSGSQWPFLTLCLYALLAHRFIHTCGSRLGIKGATAALVFWLCWHGMAVTSPHLGLFVEVIMETGPIPVYGHPIDLVTAAIANPISIFLVTFKAFTVASLLGYGWWFANYRRSIEGTGETPLAQAS